MSWKSCKFHTQVLKNLTFEGQEQQAKAIDKK